MGFDWKRKRHESVTGGGGFWRKISVTSRLVQCVELINEECLLEIRPYNAIGKRQIVVCKPTKAFEPNSFGVKFSIIKYLMNISYMWANFGGKSKIVLIMVMYVCNLPLNIPSFVVASHGQCPLGTWQPSFDWELSQYSKVDIYCRWWYEFSSIIFTRLTYNRFSTNSSLVSFNAIFYK